MVRYASRFQNILALSLAAGGVDTGTDGVPPFILDQLLFAYTAGAKFVRALYAETGSWAIVNNALETDPPVSSEQIMHPRKYLLNEGPAEDAPAGDGTLGEFVTREVLGDNPRAASAAAGWGADAWRLAGPDDADCTEEESCRNAFGLTIDWVWDSRRDATEFNAALPALLDRLGGRRDGGPWILPGQTVTALRGPLSTKLVFTPR
jgi:hypothetical protein